MRKKSFREQCPICTSTSLVDRGQIVHAMPSQVAGVEIDLSDTEYRLKMCNNCDFQFKDPPIEPEVLMDCYERSTFDHWEADPDPFVRRFDWLLEVAAQHSVGRRILDVGCFNGAALKFFGPEWDRFGVEPSDAAAKVATQRGIQVLGSNLDEIEPPEELFDVVMAIDVAEHVVEPLPFFLRLQEFVKPGGVLLISTGNTDSFHWRIQGGYYYYCRPPEHVAFYSKSTFDFLAEQLGMECAAYHLFCHKRFPFKRWVSDFFKNTVYTIVCKARGFGLPALLHNMSTRKGPTFLSSTDHIMYFFHRPREAETS